MEDVADALALASEGVSCSDCGGSNEGAARTPDLRS